VRSIAQSANLNAAHIEQRFTQMWASLEIQIKAAKETTEEEQPPAPEVSEPQRLDALTAAVRSLEATVTRMARNEASIDPGQVYYIPGDPEQAHFSFRGAGRAFSAEERANIEDIIRNVATKYRPVNDVTFVTNGRDMPSVYLRLGGKKLRFAEMKNLIRDIGDLPVKVMIAPNPPNVDPDDQT
jgi:hypothetical protein